MFELEQAIQTWRESIRTSRCAADTRVDELTDHLYCEIEALKAQGYSEEHAFLTAARQMGNIDELAAEYAKNRGLWSLLGTGCGQQLAGDSHSHSSMTARKASLIVLGHSLVFAIILLITAALMSDHPYHQTVSILILALWWASFSYLLQLPGMHQVHQAERAFFRKLFSGISRR